MSSPSPGSAAGSSSRRADDRAGAPFVVLWEPGSEFVRHCSTNAALLSALRSAYPECRVAMLGAASHLRAVDASLRAGDYDDVADDVHWVATRTFRRLRPVSRLRARVRCWDARRRLARLRPRRLLVGSTSGTGIRLLRGRRPWRGMVTLAVVHETNDLLGSPSTLSANNQRMIHALASDRSPDTRFLATTARGLAPLETIVGAGKAAAIDLPQLASVSLEERLAQVPLEQRLPRLAIFGALTPSMLAEYVCCVRSIRDHHPEATVTLIGYVKGAVDLADCPEISGVSTAPLSPTEYARRARASDYALCIRDGRRYDIRLSASVQDCLSFLVPPIATTNAFIDGLASAAPGPIGFTGLPGSRELTAVVRRVLDDPVSAEHWRHCRALDAVRAAWVPEAAAPRLRRAFESARATGT